MVVQYTPKLPPWTASPAEQKSAKTQTTNKNKNVITRGHKAFQRFPKEQCEHAIEINSREPSLANSSALCRSSKAALSTASRFSSL